MNMCKKMFCLLLVTMLSAAVHGQATNAETMDMMRSNGKIYVVVAVVVTILLGLFIYLLNLDRKIKKMEGK